MDATEELVVNGTFAQATVTEMAAHAGVSRATIFSQFGSKLGVLEALATRCAGGPEMRAIRAAVALDDPIEALRSIVLAACDLWERQGHILLTLKAVAELEPGAHQIVDAQREDQRSSLESIAKRLKVAGALDGMRVAEATAALHWITSVESFMELRRNARLSLEATRRIVLETATRLIGVAAEG